VKYFIVFLQMADFQNKLSELEKSQSELVAQNASLKDLCVYLNEQREHSLAADMAGLTVSRDSGDGSSGSSPSIDKLVPTVHVSDTLKPQQPAKGVYVYVCFLKFLLFI